VHADELEELANLDESRGYTDELISLLEVATGLDGNHNGMFTELAILYSKYRPEKLMEHLENYHPRLNTHKVIRICEKNYQWPELTFLHVHDDEFDSAALIMINHSVDAWDPTLFKEVIKSASLDIGYKAISFYLEFHPLLVNELLAVLAPRADHTRVVNIVRGLNKFSFIKQYLVSVQQVNVPAVNEALNRLLIEEEDYEALKTSIDAHDAFDPISLAESLRTHDLLEFRRIAAYLYKKNNKFAESIGISRKDNIWKDAIQTACDSKSQEVCEDLLKYFVERQRSDCFAAALYTCYNYVRPDVALELAWKHNFIDFVMPFLVQTVREYTVKVDELWNEHKKRDELGATGLAPGYDATGQVVVPQDGQVYYQIPVGAEAFGYGGVPLSGTIPIAPASAGGVFHY